MSEEKILIQWMTGYVDIRKAPPAVTLAGLPALPGESWVEYHHRALAAIKPIEGAR